MMKPQGARRTGLWLSSMEAMRPRSRPRWLGMHSGVPTCRARTPTPQPHPLQLTVAGSRAHADTSAQAGGTPETGCSLPGT